MGHLDRMSGHNPLSKMNIPTWSSLILAVIITLSTPAVSAEPRVVCYYTNWSVYRPGTARFNPQNINPYLCTHLIYAFGGFTKDNTLKPFDKYQDIEKGGYAKFTGLKTYNKNLKTLLAIGGWNEGSTRFSPMVASRERRKEFVRNVIKFLRQNRFDGLDLDWEYPAFRDGGKPKDRENYSKLVRELREEFEREAEKTGKTRLLLTMAVPAGIEYIQKGFDVKTLNQYLDWMNLLTYDYHSAFEPAVNHHAPLYALEEPNEYSVDTELNIDYTIKFYLENGADPDKLVLGIPTYGRSYTLFNADAVEIGSPADGPGEQGDATREKGYLAYYEICEALKPKEPKKRSTDEDSEEDSEEVEEEWTVMHPNPNAMGPVAFKGNQWVGYDDIDIVKKKAAYVAENGLGGIMFWSIDNDDFRGNCHQKPYPLIEAAKEAYIARLGSSDLVVTERAKIRPSAAKRRNRPKASTTTTTAKPSAAAKSNKRKSSVSSTTPSWNITPEPPTTPDPGSDFKCVDEGFFPHPRDCKKYFWCLDSGPSNLGIVAHSFTCPSGLFFNKAADSCDFARNVLCKMPAATTKAPATRAPSTTTARATTLTTRKPVRLSTKNSVLFRTTTTTSTTPEPESEEYYEEDIIVPDTADEDAEDPRVIKELIDLIKKVGGVEQLEKQLHLAETAVTNGNVPSTTPSAFNKKLYQKVLERTRGKNKYTGKSISQESAGQNSRRGPQNQGLEPAQDKDKLLKKDRPQYTTINRNRPTTSPPESDSEEVDETAPAPVQPSRARAVDEDGTTTRPLQYVNIRRARPTTSDTADDTASRNALFERAESYVTVSEASLDISNARRENQPEYVTIRRQRPTTEETTTVRFEESKENQEVELQQTILEREISSQPQYTSIVRTRATTPPPEPTTSEQPRTYPTTTSPEKPSSPEPTTVLAVQISSLLNLNTPTSDGPESSILETTVAQTTEEITTSTTSSTVPPSTGTPRRPLIRRRGSTTTTTASPIVSSSTTQVSPRNYSFIRRRRPNFKPNEISDSDNDIDLSRKIRSTTPDSREVEGAKTDRETRVSGARRFRSRFQTTRVDDSVSAAASPISRGQFRPRVNPDEIISLTPIDVEPQFVPRQTFTSRNENRGFRSRTTAVADSEASAATIEASRPRVIARGRSRYTFSTTTETAEEPIIETTPSPRRPTFARFSPRPFARPSTTAEEIEVAPEDNIQVATLRSPPRLPFGRSRPTSTTSSPIQARKLPFTSRYITTPQPLVDNEDELENKHDDIHLSESAIEEQEHESEELDEAPKRRVIIRKFKTPTTEPSPTETIPIDEDGKRKFRIIRRRPVSTAASTETVISTDTPVPRIRKIIRKKLNKPLEDEPEIIAKFVGSLDVSSSTEAIIEAANYGEKQRPTQITTSTSAAESVTESIAETSSESEIVTAKEEEQQIKQETEENDVDQSAKSESQDVNTSEVVVETEQKAIDLSENKEPPEIETTTAKEDETSPETTTASTTTQTPSSRTRLPYRPQKRIFTSTTEAVPSSTKTFSRKFNPGVYTSPASVSTRTPPSFRPAGARRPASQLFTRRPFTTARTTTRAEEEDEEELYSDEELLEEEPENPFAFVPSGQFYSKRPEFDQEHDGEDSSEILDEEEETEGGEPQNRLKVTTKKPFRPKAVNSNTFRTTTSTTELPKQLSTLQNKTAIYSRFGGVKQENDTNKRVQNVPVGYNVPVAQITETLSNEEQKSDLTTTETTTDETTTDDDYLSMTETTATGSDTTNTDSLSTNTIDAETSTLQMEISTNDYLEYTEQTTYFPTTKDATTNAQTTLLQNTVTSGLTTTQTSPKPTTNAPVSPKVKTQFDKLFSVSRVVEVSSKLDKHRLNKNNETTFIEEGEVMQEKKPMIDKIGEVSRYSLIKIVEDEIPIYLTKLGHVYPVDNPPDNLIRIDEARNARALTSYFEPLRENLVASESVNEAYRHVQKAADLVKGETEKEIEKVPGDDFLSYINDKGSDKVEDPLFAQWQFIPAAYENEQNKAIKSYEIVTPRSMQSETNPSTLPLQSLFKTEAPTARKLSDNSQPFVVYSASVPTQKEEATIVKLDVLKPEVGRSIITFAKGQEFSGAPITEETTKSAISVSIVPKTESPTTTSTTTTESLITMTSPIVEMLSTPDTTVTETTVFTTTDVPSTTETIPEETTTVKLNPVEAKRAKYGLLRRPIIKTANTTRFNIPRPAAKKSNVTLNGNLIKKSNKTSTFTPNKSRFSAIRTQNVPVDLKKKPSTRVPKVFTTEAPRASTERKPYFKPGRPTLRPAFVPRRTTLPPTTVFEDSS